MCGVAAAIGGSAVLGYVGSQSAAGKQAGAMDAATALQREEFNYQQAVNAPYQEAGTKALTQMQDPRFQKNFGMSDFKTSPGYQFSLQQGNNALKAMNAATGNSVSGAGMAALDKYNVGTANNEYQQAFNNYQTEVGNQYGRLSTLASGGAGANQAMGTAARSYADAAGNNMAGAANAQAAGTMAGANAIGTGLTGLAGYMNKPSLGGNSNGYSMSQFSSSPASNLQMPSGPLGGGQSMSAFGD